MSDDGFKPFAVSMSTTTCLNQKLRFSSQQDLSLQEQAASAEVPLVITESIRGPKGHEICLTHVFSREEL